jgi:hypothetical protein
MYSLTNRIAQYHPFLGTLRTLSQNFTPLIYSLNILINKHLLTLTGKIALEEGMLLVLD